MPEPGLEPEPRSAGVGAPFTAYRERVRAEWLDYNGHLHDASYATVLSDAHELVFEDLGLSADYRDAVRTRRCSPSRPTSGSSPSARRARR